MTILSRCNSIEFELRPDMSQYNVKDDEGLLSIDPEKFHEDPKVIIQEVSEISIEDERENAEAIRFTNNNLQISLLKRSELAQDNLVSVMDGTVR